MSQTALANAPLLCPTLTSISRRNGCVCSRNRHPRLNLTESNAIIHGTLRRIHQTAVHRDRKRSPSGCVSTSSHVQVASFLVCISSCINLALQTGVTVDQTPSIPMRVDIAHPQCLTLEQFVMRGQQVVEKTELRAFPESFGL